MFGNQPVDCGALRQEYNERCKNQNPRTAQQKRKSKIKKVNQLSRVCPKYSSINPFYQLLPEQVNAAAFDAFYVDLWNRNLAIQEFHNRHALFGNQFGGDPLNELAQIQAEQALQQQLVQIQAGQALAQAAVNGYIPGNEYDDLFVDSDVESDVEDQLNELDQIQAEQEEQDDIELPGQLDLFVQDLNLAGGVEAGGVGNG